jgi:hypothetical protein
MKRIGPGRHCYSRPRAILPASSLSSCARLGVISAPSMELPVMFPPGPSDPDFLAWMAGHPKGPAFQHWHWDRLPTIDFPWRITAGTLVTAAVALIFRTPPAFGSDDSVAVIPAVDYWVPARAAPAEQGSLGRDDSHMR